MGELNPTVLLFAVLAIIQLRRSVESAMLDVFLPVLLLVPAVYWFRMPHLPAFPCVDAVLVPLAIAALITRSHNWRFKRADLWVVCFVLASGYTDYINIGLSGALLNFPNLACDTFFAYFVGKLLIEEGGFREQFAQRITVLLAATGFISIIEFVGKVDIYTQVARLVFFSHPYQAEQMRSGFLRVKGPFAGAEQAGIVFMMGFFIALWFWYANKARPNLRERKYFGLKRSTLLVCGISLGLYMTLSRGPWLGALAGFSIARIGLVKNRRIAIVLALVLAAVGGVYSQVKTNQYSELVLNDKTTETEMSAHYRTQLYTVYEPVAERGGLFGWSGSTYPRDRVYDSIDNEYLFLWVANGKVGITLFILIMAEAALAIVWAVRRSRHPVDTCFYYCLGGSLAGLMLVLSTVYLYAQGYVLFFLFIGWSQSLRQQRREVEAVPQGSEPRFAFRRVFA
jgi:O-Antigen ligase